MTAMSDWDDTVVRLRKTWGTDLDLTAIAMKFVPFFHGPRIRVDVGAWQPLTGRVSLTSGWKPALLLMERSSDTGSLWTLHDTHDLLAVQIGGRYVALDDSRVISMYARWAATHGGIQ